MSEPENPLESLTCQQLVEKLVFLFQNDKEENAIDEALDWFLYAYSPEHNFEGVTKNAEALKNAQLLKLILTKIKEVYEPEIFFETFNVVSSIDGNEQNIAMAGGVKTIVSMMSRDLQNARSQQLGCKIVANLACDLDVRLYLGKTRGIQKIAEALRVHQASHDVVLEACKAFTNLSVNSRLNKSLILHEGVVETLISVMELHASNFQVINQCLTTIRNLAIQVDYMAAIELEIDRSKLVKTAFLYMRKNESHSGIQTNGIWILIATMAADIDQKICIFDEGGVELVNAAMHLHRADELLQIAGATFLGLLCKIASLRNHIASTNSLQLILSAMRTFRTDIEYLRAALKTIYRMAFSSTAREKFAEVPNLLERIFESMQEHPTVGPLQRIAILTLQQLSKNDRLKAAMQKECVPLFLTAISNFKATSTMQHVHQVAQLALADSMGGDTISTTGENALLDEIDELKDKLTAKEKTEADLKKQNQSLQDQLNAYIKKEQDSMTAEERLKRAQEQLKKEEKLLKNMQEKKKSVLVELNLKDAKAGLRHVETDKKDKAKDEPKPKKEMKKETPKRIPTLTVTPQQLANKKAEHHHGTGTPRPPPEKTAKSTSKSPKGKRDGKTTSGPSSPSASHSHSASASDSTTAPSSTTASGVVKNRVPMGANAHTASNSRQRDNWLAVRRSLQFPTQTHTNATAGETHVPSGDARRDSRTLPRNQLLQRVPTNSDTLPLKLEISNLTDKVEGLLKEREAQAKKMEDIEKELETKKFELQTSHLFIETLRKERAQQTELYSQDDKSGFFQRNQKKVRQLKRDIDYLTSENGKLKVEIESLKGQSASNHISSASSQLFAKSYAGPFNTTLDRTNNTNSSSSPQEERKDGEMKDDERRDSTEKGEAKKEKPEGEKKDSESKAKDGESKKDKQAKDEGESKKNSHDSDSPRTSDQSSKLEKKDRSEKKDRGDKSEKRENGERTPREKGSDSRPVSDERDKSATHERKENSKHEKAGKEKDGEKKESSRAEKKEKASSASSATPQTDASSKGQEVGKEENGKADGSPKEEPKEGDGKKTETKTGEEETETPRTKVSARSPSTKDKSDKRKEKSSK